MNKATSILIIAALAIAIPMVAYMGYQYFRPPAEVADMAADMKENAQTIGSEYLKDELKADQKYLGKTVDISGRIEEIKREESEGLTIYFEANEQGAPVAVLMNTKDTVVIFPNKGDSVLIRGICTGFLMDVTFNRGMVMKNFQ